MAQVQDLYQAAGIDPSQGQNPPPPDLYAAIGGTGVSSLPDKSITFMHDIVHQLPLADKGEALLRTIGVEPGGIGGQGGSALQTVGAEPDISGSFGARYRANLTNARGDISDFEAQHPEQAYGAKAVGVIAPMLAMGPEAAVGDALAPTMRQAAVSSGKTGATLGGAYGLSGTDDSSLGQDLAATGVGAVAGGVAGAALPVGLGIAAAPFRMGARATNIFGQAGVDKATGRVLSNAVTSPNLNFEPAPLPGMDLTTGQSSNDPGLLWLERSTRQATPQGAQLSADATAANNGAIRTGIGQLGDQTSNPSQDMATALDTIQAKRKAANVALWKQADISNTGGVSGFQFNNYMQKYIAGLPVADQASIPKNVTDIMGKLAEAKTQNLSDVQSVRSMLGSQATMAARSGDANTARILGGLADQTESFIDMKAQNLGQTYPLYNQARADTKDMKQTFSTQPAARKYFGVDAYGADKLPVSSTADNFIHSGKGAPEDLNTYLNMISTKDPQTGKVTYDPAGLKAAQDAFSQKFLGTVTNAGTDQTGANLVSPAKMQKFLDDYSHVINSPLFTQPQRDLVSRVARATQMASRTATAQPPGGGSDTFQKLQGDKFIDALVGPGASKLVNVGGTLGGLALGAAHGPVEAVAGAFGGGKVADMISSLYNAPRAKVINLVTEAMHDPQLAQTLMQKASNGNAKLISPPTRTKLLGLLGAQAAQPAAQALTAQ